MKSVRCGLGMAGIVLAGVLFTGSQAGAAFVNASYAWTGSAGWRASGLVRYDETLAFPSALGELYGGSGTSNGIEYLDLAIYNPIGVLMGSWIQIEASAVLYQTLRMTIDSTLDALAAGGRLEIGNTAVRSAYFGGTQGSAFLIGWNYSIVDRGPGALTFVVQPDTDPSPVSAPGTAGLLVLGIGLVVGLRRVHAR